MYFLRFDMRSPEFSAAQRRELYQAAIDMAAWGESNGCLAAMLSEHHCASDAYLPSPLILATAIAARTNSLRINIGALLLNLYDPIKLAEDITVLDIISGGRTSFTMGLGYREKEYAMFGVNYAQRAALIEEKLGALLQALSGGEFSYQGRQVEVTPAPQTGNQIAISYGGRSRAAARRAGKFGLDFFANGGDASLEEVYREAARTAGHEPGNVSIPEPGSVQVLFVSEDLDRAWQDIGPYMLHDARVYRQWEGDAHSAVTSYATSIEELRAENGAYQIVTPEIAIDMLRQGSLLMLHPLVGGCPPELGWQSMRLVAEQVLPASQS